MSEAGRQSKHPEDVSFRQQMATLPAEEILGMAALALGVERAAFNERRRMATLEEELAASVVNY